MMTTRRTRWLSPCTTQHPTPNPNPATNPKVVGVDYDKHYVRKCEDLFESHHLTGRCSVVRTSIYDYLPTPSGAFVEAACMQASKHACMHACRPTPSGAFVEAACMHAIKRQECAMRRARLYALHTQRRAALRIAHPA